MSTIRVVGECFFCRKLIGERIRPLYDPDKGEGWTTLFNGAVAHARCTNEATKERLIHPDEKADGS